MIDELEALVGYILVVSGRAVSSPPPGALVQLPPKKPQRGREQDTFFTLVTIAGANQAQATFYEQLAKLAADLYFRTGGGVTSGLRDSIAGVNSYLNDHNQKAGQRYEANIICLVMRGREIYVARSGSCLALFRQGESFLTFPDDLRDELVLNTLPLGYSPVPDIKLAHYDIAPGHVMVLADTQLAQADRDKLFNALGAGHVQDVMEPLKGLTSGGKLQAMVIEFVTVDMPDPTVSTPVAGMKVQRSSAAPATTAAVAPVASSGAAPGVIAAPAPKPNKSKPVRPTPPASPNEAATAESGVPPAPEIAPPVGERVTETSRNAQRAGRSALGGVASFLSTLVKVFNNVLDRLLPEPSESGPRIPGMLAAGLAVLVPVIVVFIVVAFRLSQVDMSEYEQTVRDVQAAANQAASIKGSGPDGLQKSRQAWREVLKRIDNVEVSSGRTNDPTLDQIAARAQGILDGYDIVTRRQVTPLRSFSDGAQLIGPIIRGGTDMYTLDTHTSAIYRDTLNGDADSISNRSTQPVVQQGQAVGARSVSQMIDMTWMATGGVRGANLIAALDIQSGILITYSPTFSPATAQTLPGTDLWTKPISMTIWQERLYLLDPDANQIWRYVPEGSTYPNTPEAYFDAGSQPSLSGAVDFGIDNSGYLYILFTNGTIRKYSSGVQQPFSYIDLPDGALHNANSLYLDNDSEQPAMYITDPQDQAIYEMTLAGRFRYRFKAAESDAFDKLTGVYVDGNHTYVASGSVVYFFNTSDLAATPTPKPTQ